MTHLSQGHLPKAGALTTKKQQKSGERRSDRKTAAPRDEWVLGRGVISSCRLSYGESKISTHNRLKYGCDQKKTPPTSQVQNPAGPCRTPGLTLRASTMMAWAHPGLSDVSRCTQKSPFETITFVKDKGGDSQGFGRLCGPADQSMRWHQTRGQTPKLCQKKCCDAIVIALYYDTVLLSVVDLNIDVTGKKVQPCCGEETSEKWGKEPTCWPKREWSKWSKQLPTGDNNFKEARHFTWHFNLPTSARIINYVVTYFCFDLYFISQQAVH